LAAVLLELRVQNLLLIDSAELVLDRGLNVITGETGAGKTVLAQALDLLLGGRPRPNVVRPGAEEAYVEGVFSAPRSLAADPALAGIAERLPLDGEEIVLARRVTAAGRTRAYLQGRSATAQELGAVGTRLLAFFGQHEHRKLMLASAQLGVLDAFCGERQLERRSKLERVLGTARRLERDLTELRERAGVRERDLDLLEFEIEEIADASPSEAEEEALEQERSRLTGVEALREAAGRATVAIDSGGDYGGSDGEADALGSLSIARSALARAEGRDDALDALARRTESLLTELQELGLGLRDYLSSLEADPTRLSEIEERLELFGRLKRKHGGSIASVLEHAERCRTERERLANLGEATTVLEAELEGATSELESLALGLHAERVRAAPGLAKAVRVELRELAMGEAAFEVRVEPRDPAAEGVLDRFTATAADAVEFVIATNPGVPAGPLREVASGGEMSRVMLALMTVATAREGAATVVFDEVDAGVGGGTARAVGEKLRSLAAGRQVVCITHLPQVASLAARHFRVVKDSGATSGGRRRAAVARAEVERLERGELVAELCRMLGADSGDLAARRHAEELLQAA
jgi:DNA repair protein RecN (Recombination protein N)